MPSPAVGSQPPEEAPVTRRSTELLMTAFGLAIVALAFAATALSLKGQHPSTIIGYIVSYCVIIIGAHLAVRKFAPYADPLLLPIATLLNGLGLVMIYRLNQAGRNGNTGAPGLSGAPVPISTLGSSATVTQVIYTVLGVAVFVLFLWLVKDIKVLQPYTYILGLAGLVLIALPALLPGSISGVADTSAKIQINIGGFSVQPEEFGKLLLAASFASYLMEHGQQLSLLTDKWLFFKMPRRKDLAPIFVVWALSMLLLIFESDIGTSAVFMGLFVAMLYIATGRRSWAILGFVMFLLGALAAATLVSHVGQRFSIWLHPFTTANLVDGTQPSYQTAQGLYGMANGGLLGRGLGGGQPFWTPLVQSDLIFTAFGEELGPGRRDGAAAALRPARAARPAHRPAGQGRVLQAARQRPRLHVRAPGVRDRGRGDPGDPAHRHHHPVPLAGRLQPGGELAAGRRDRADERHRAPPGAAADPG